MSREAKSPDVLVILYAAIGRMRPTSGNQPGLKAAVSGPFFDRGRVPLRSPFPHRLEEHLTHRDDEDAD
jgi:hypothetical protein